MTDGFSTVGVAPSERVDFWREMVWRYFVPLRIEPLADGPFDGTVRLRSVGELDAARVRARPMLAARGFKHIEHSAGDEYFIGLHLHGVAHAEQDGRTATLMPGDFALFDSARPYTIAFHAAGTFDHLIIRIPCEQLDLRMTHVERLTAVAVKAGSAAGQLAAPVLTKFAWLDWAAPFVDPILDLIAAALPQAAGLTASQRRDRPLTLDQINRFTLAHHAYADLSPARAARACFVSPRELHRLFQREGTTFGAFLRETRLRRIRRDLADPELAGLTIADVGRRHGYERAPVLTRAFTRRYGVGPHAFRQAVRGTGRQRAILELFDTSDFREGVAAVTERRSPSFTGG